MPSLVETSRSKYGTRNYLLRMWTLWPSTPWQKQLKLLACYSGLSQSIIIQTLVTKNSIVHKIWSTQLFSEFNLCSYLDLDSSSQTFSHDTQAVCVQTYKVWFQMIEQFRKYCSDFGEGFAYSTFSVLCPVFTSEEAEPKHMVTNAAHFYSKTFLRYCISLIVPVFTQFYCCCD